MVELVDLKRTYVLVPHSGDTQLGDLEVVQKFASKSYAEVTLELPSLPEFIVQIDVSYKIGTERKRTFRVPDSFLDPPSQTITIRDLPPSKDVLFSAFVTYMIDTDDRNTLFKREFRKRVTLRDKGRLTLCPVLVDFSCY